MTKDRLQIEYIFVVNSGLLKRIQSKTYFMKNRKNTKRQKYEQD